METDDQDIDLTTPHDHEKVVKEDEEVVSDEEAVPNNAPWLTMEYKKKKKLYDLEMAFSKYILEKRWMKNPRVIWKHKRIP